MRLEYKIGVVVAVAVVGLGSWFFMTRDRASDTPVAVAPDTAKPVAAARQASPQPTPTVNRPTPSPTTPRPMVRPQPSPMPTAVTTRPASTGAPNFSLNPDRSASPGIRSETPVAKPETSMERPTAFADRPAPPIARPLAPPTGVSDTPITSATPVRPAPVVTPVTPAVTGTPSPAPAGPAGAAATPASTAKTHVMKQGDTIQGLSIKYYGSAKHASLILDANKQYTDARRIPVGAKITIPPAPAAAADATKTGAPGASPTASPSADVRIASAEPRRQPPNTKPYVVKKGDTWRKLAAQYYGSETDAPQLFELNKRSPNETMRTLKTGDTIYVPTTSTSVAPPARTLIGTTPKP